MIQTPVDIIRNRCFICEDDKFGPCSPPPSLPYLDTQFSDAETIVTKELLEDVGLAPVEVQMIPPYFAAEYDFRGYASLDVFEDLRVQATFFPFMPPNYAHWPDYSIPLSRFFFLDAEWISWGDTKGWDQEDQEQYEELAAEGGDTSTDSESLDAQDNCSCDPQPSLSEKSSGASPGLFSFPSMEDTRRRRTIYYARPPLIRAQGAAGDKPRRRQWPSTSSFSSIRSGVSQHTRQKFEETDRI